MKCLLELRGCCDCWGDNMIVVEIENVNEYQLLEKIAVQFQNNAKIGEPKLYV